MASSDVRLLHVTVNSTRVLEEAVGVTGMNFTQQVDSRPWQMRRALYCKVRRLYASKNNQMLWHLATNLRLYLCEMVMLEVSELKDICCEGVGLVFRQKQDMIVYKYQIKNFASHPALPFRSPPSPQPIFQTTPDP
jgi:hypothetical protein